MSQSMKLLQPVTFGGDLALKNRLALAPLTRGRCGRSQVPNTTSAEYYVQRSTAGLVITEGTITSKQAMGWAGAAAIYSSEHVEGWKMVTKKVHAAKGVIFCQLWHMGRQASSCFHGLKPIAASAIAAEGRVTDYDGSKINYEVPRAVKVEEMPTILEEYRVAARNCKEAGFDGIELHCANGYFLDSFLQSCSNTRTDAYGGSPENRFRFIREVLEVLKESFPINRIGMRFSPNGVYGSMGSADNIETYSYVFSQLDPNMGYLHAMDGLAFGYHEKCPVFTLEMVRKLYKGTIMGNCGYTKETAEEAVKSGNADMIAFGRPYIGNPDLPARFENDWPLVDADPSTYYSYPGAHGAGSPSIGYSDWPVYSK